MLEHLKNNQTDIDTLIKYYDTHILQEEEAKINSLKRFIFALMKRYEKSNINLNKKYYELYQELKNKEISYDDALNKVMQIKE